MALTRTLASWDYVVLAASLTLSVAIGIYHACSGGKQKTTSEFMLANKNLNVLPAALSMVVSFESSIMMIGLPGEIYAYGIQFALNAIGFSISAILIGVFVAPLYYDLRVISSYEYLEARFKSRGVRLVGCLLGMSTTLMYMGVVLYGPATALEAVTGLQTWKSVLLITAVAIVYTSIGGMKAVAWADAFQFVIMLGGMIGILAVALHRVGSFEEVIEYAKQGGRLEPPVVSVDPRVRVSVWGMLIGTAISGCDKSSQQTIVQRISSVASKKSAILIVLKMTRRGLLFQTLAQLFNYIGFAVIVTLVVILHIPSIHPYNIVLMMAPGGLMFQTLSGLIGLVAFAFYQKSGCDPMADGSISNPNQVIPYFVLEIFQDYPGLSGVFIAALFSASLSTLSSGYTSLATVAWTDFIQPCFPKTSDFTATVITKFLVAVLGAMVVGVAFVMNEVGGPMTQMCGDFINAFSGAGLGLFLLAALVPVVNNKGVLAGCFTAVVISLWKGFGASFVLPNTNTYLPFISETCNGTYNISIDAFDERYSTTHNINSSIFLESTSSSDSDPLVYNFYSLSFLWVGFLGASITISVALIVSYITGIRDPSTVQPHHLIPLKQMLCCCITRKTQRTSLKYDVTSIEDQHDALVLESMDKSETKKS